LTVFLSSALVYRERVGNIETHRGQVSAGSMDSESKAKTEQLLAEAFTGLLHISQRSGVTIKRMRKLMAMVQVRDMKRQGMTHQRIKAASGFSLKTIRRLLKMDVREDGSD